MKKIMVFSLSLLLVMSSCGSYEAAGAATGAHFGSIIGSAIGGISGGWRGHDVGSLIGLAGGAVVGAAIGKAADDKAEARAAERYERHRAANAARHQDAIYDDSGFDPSGRGDDRIMLDGMTGPVSTVAPMPLEISHARLVDASRDGQLTRGESAHVVFEIHNPSTKPVYGVQPSVTEVTGNKHIHISENILVECIPPQQTIRYTAQVKADNGLRNGEAVIRVSVLQGGRELPSQSRTFRIVTTKR
jgi:hypothetical protein